jgi:hypothetical protein
MPAKITLANPTPNVTSVKLRAGVAIVLPVVSESNQQPVVSTFAEIPAAAVTHVYPVSNTAHVLLASSAYLDTTGRFKLFTDSFSISDNTYLTPSKVFDTDSFYLEDAITAINVDKVISDSVTMLDSVVAVLVFFRGLTETLFTSDSGLLVLQNYCDITYFATDYVGESRTF